MEQKTLSDYLIEIREHYGTQAAIARVTKNKASSISAWYPHGDKPAKAKPSYRSLMRIQKDTRGKFKAKQIRPELFE